MLERVDNPSTKPQTDIVLPFKVHTAQKETEHAGTKGNRFAEIDLVLDDLFRNDRLHCA